MLEEGGPNNIIVLYNVTFQVNIQWKVILRLEVCMGFTSASFVPSLYKNGDFSFISCGCDYCDIKTRKI